MHARILLWMMVPGFLGIWGCSDSDGPIGFSCPAEVGTSCATESGGANVNIDLNSLSESGDYIIVVLSQQKALSTDDKEIAFSLKSDVASAPIPSEELKKLKEVQHRQNFHPNLNTANDQPILPPRSPFQSNTLLLSDEAKVPTSSDSHLQALSSFTAQEVGANFQFYVPDPEDYDTGNKVDRFYIHSPSGSTLKGSHRNFELFETLENFHQYWINIDDTGAPLSQLKDNPKKHFTAVSSCLKKVVPMMVDNLGRPPYDLDGQPEVNVLMTRINPASRAKTIGLFSSLDLFRVNNRSDSNGREIVYIDPEINAGAACSTFAHEFTHMMSFKHKVIGRLPEDRRADLAYQRESGVYPEDLGLNEGSAHLFEELSGEYQTVSHHVYRFLLDPQRTSFGLEAVRLDDASASRSRGLNTLFMYYLTKRVGGSLATSDPITRSFHRSWIESPETGFDNIAKILKTSRLELFQDFFTKFSLSLFLDNYAHDKFIPGQVKEGGTTRGISLMNRSEAASAIPLAPPVFHPMQSNLPLLTESDVYSLPPEGLLMFRYIGQKNIKSGAQLQINSNGTPFNVVIVPLK